MDDRTMARIILDRMKKAAGVRTQAELAATLGIKPPSVSEAAIKGRIPERWFDILFEKTGATKEDLCLPPEKVMAALDINLSTPESEPSPPQSDMLIMTSKVLESQTVYRSALASNIRAFYQAVKNEEEMGKLSDQMTQLQKELAEVKQRLESIEHQPEKKRAGNHD
jgi:hypothetical protein